MSATRRRPARPAAPDDAPSRGPGAPGAGSAPEGDLAPPRLALAMWKRFLLGSLSVVLLTATATASTVLLDLQESVSIFNEAGGRDAKIDFGDDVTRAEAGDARTFLLLGSDKRYGERRADRPPNSDTMILVRLDPDSDVVTTMAIPRDTVVDIPGHGVDRINAAYRFGGPRLAVKTVRQLMETATGEPFDVNHVVNVNFEGFQRAVNFIGCVYTDVDRRYFNDNRQGGELYATIDVKPGYQELCGKDSLDYVRYRHEDNDVVRGARQQDYLRHAKEQLNATNLFSNRNRLARLFGRYTQTDSNLRSTADVIALLKLAQFMAGRNVVNITFPAVLGEAEVRAPLNRLNQAVRRFLAGSAEGTDEPRGRTRRRREDRELLRVDRSPRPRRDAGNGLEDARVEGENQAIEAQPRLRYPFFYPRLRTRTGRYVETHVYDLLDRDKKRYRSYRTVVWNGSIGEYYGIQGTAWKDAPILGEPHDTERHRGRTFRVYYTGRRIRLIAWEGPRAVYWISNTLLHSLSNDQMREIARSTRPARR